ncbi:MAG: zinc ribbon domain-containing protein [Thermoproteota archaeon]
MCPRCDLEKSLNNGRLFKCLNCGLEAHRDAVGVFKYAIDALHESWETFASKAFIGCSLDFCPPTSFHSILAAKGVPSPR